MNNFHKGLIGAIAATSFLGLNPSPATAQLTPAEERSAECLGYALGALISGDTSLVCSSEELSEFNNTNQYQDSNYYNQPNAVGTNQQVDNEIRRQEFQRMLTDESDDWESYQNDEIRKMRLRQVQLERRNDWATSDDGICLSCSD